MAPKSMSQEAEPSSPTEAGDAKQPVQEEVEMEDSDATTTKPTNSDEKEDKKEEPEETEAEKKKKEALRKKYANWPVRNIKEPHENDVMYGRGGGTNHHPGNKNYRKMVEDRKVEYVSSKRLDKPLVALEIIRIWRSQVPSGRFLKLDDKTGLWNDVGDKKAREKTSQALREKAPLIRKQQEGGNEDEESGAKDSKSKSTRFAAGTKTSSDLQKSTLARDHSLGREYLDPGESVSIADFTWQDPFKRGSRDSSLGPAHMAGRGGPSYPAGRISSSGSMGMAPPPHHVQSIGGPPPPPDYWGRTTSADRQREFSTGRYDSWGSTLLPYPPPPAPGMHHHQRSGSWTHPLPPPHSPAHHRSGSWTRDHSLSTIPLPGASIASPADRGTFDSGRAGSGYWADVLSTPGRSGGPPPPAGHPGPFRQPHSPSRTSTPSPKPYSVDMSIAKSWSGGEVASSWSGEDGPPAPLPAHTEFAENGQALPRPSIVKRDTSNQNESCETKPSVKRAALNRDNSLASNRLKAEYMPEYYSKKFDTEQEMSQLSSNLEQSKLSPHRLPPPRPEPLGGANGERESTIDIIAREMAKPAPIMGSDRMSTIDALGIALSDGVPLAPVEDVPELKQDVPKPAGITPNDRLTTKDFMDLVNAPIGEDDPPAVREEKSLKQERIADEWMTKA